MLYYKQIINIIYLILVIGTLGGFFKVKDEIYAMTCAHIKDESNEFQQPSLVTINSCKTRLPKRNIEKNDKIEMETLMNEKSLQAGTFDSTYFQNQINDNSCLDYHLLKCHRHISNDYNKITTENYNLVSKTVISINEEQMKELLNSEFAKLGAKSDLTFSSLYNSKKDDVRLKIGKSKCYTGTETTIEYAFLNEDEEFILRGDSGSLVFDTDNGEVFGVAFACTLTSPYFGFVTPLTTICENFSKSFNEKLVLI